MRKISSVNNKVTEHNTLVIHGNSMPSNHMLCIQPPTADDDDENVKNHQGSGLNGMFLKLKKIERHKYPI